MCGIAGIIEGDVPSRERRRILERMCRVITHRGPDDLGMFFDDRAALGMRRLAIIDLSGGRQPMTGPGIVLVCNGEIYNFRELRKELESHGRTFSTNSDVETIVHAYAVFGPDCLRRLRGMFAVAVWDAQARTLMLARDRAGEKPLYYTITRSGALIFGSELKVLRQHPEVATEIDPEALDAYVSLGYVPDPLSIFKGIEKLPPGCRLLFRNGLVTVEPYWDFAYRQTPFRREEEYAAELRRLIEESVRLQLVADVPVGAFLSGGIDSGAVVGLMARHLTRPVKTFSVGFSESGYSELIPARRIARRFNTEHTELLVGPDIGPTVETLVAGFDEPFADAAAIPNYLVARLAREQVTVALSGDGGDELFAGYTRYAIHQRRAWVRLPRWLREGLLRPVSHWLPPNAYGKNFLYHLSLDAVDRHADAMSAFPIPHRKLLYGEVMPPVSDGVGFRFRHLAGQVHSGDSLDRLLYIDAKTYLPGDILTKVDRTSMANSLEVRAPLLDHVLIDFVTGIPAAFKLRGGRTKHIFKRCLEGLLPPDIIDRPKHGFSVPIREWLQGPLHEQVHDVLLGRRLRERGYFNQAYIAGLLAEHDRGRRDLATQIWTLYMLEAWFLHFIDGAEGPAATEAQQVIQVA